MGNSAQVRVHQAGSAMRCSWWIVGRYRILSNIRRSYTYLPLRFFGASYIREGPLFERIYHLPKESLMHYLFKILLPSEYRMGEKFTITSITTFPWSTSEFTRWARLPRTIVAMRKRMDTTTVESPDSGIMDMSNYGFSPAVSYQNSFPFSCLIFLNPASVSTWNSALS